MVQTLKGRTVALTRPCGQADEAAQLIRQRGWEPYFIPTIEIKPLTDFSAIKPFIAALAGGKVDFVVFMSVNGVRHLFDAAAGLKETDRLIAGLQKSVTVSVGPRTAEELEARQIHVDLVPTQYTSDGIAQAMLTRFQLAGKTVAVPRTTSASPTLKDALSKVGANVEEVYVYESGIPNDEQVKKRFLEDLQAEKIDAVVFGSALCAKNLFHMLSSHISAKKLRDLINQKLAVVAIGPVTAQALGELGVRIDVMPKSHVFEDAIAELAQFWQN
jgi:uroporphyrinogen-III synthase